LQSIPTKSKRKAGARALAAAESAAAAGMATVAFRPSAASWQQAYEKLRDANKKLEMARAIATGKLTDPRKKEQEESEKEMQQAMEAARAFGSAPIVAGDAAAGGDGLSRPAGRTREVQELRPKMLSLAELQDVGLDSEKLAEVSKLREAIGPGTMPLLAALFGEPTSDDKMPALNDVQFALGLPGSIFRPRRTVDLKRCFVVRGFVRPDNMTSPGLFLTQVQQRLDRRFGGALVAFLQRERYDPSPALASVAGQSGFQDVGPGAGGEDGSQAAALFVFLKTDLPIPMLYGKPGPFRRLLVGFSLAVSVVFCNTVALATKVLQDEGDLLAKAPLQEMTYSPTFGTAVSSLDSLALLPIGLVLLLSLAAQEAGRSAAAARHDVDLRSGFFLPWPSLGCLGRTWGPEGLLPSRLAEQEIILGGRFAAIAVALLAIVVGLLRGDPSQGPLLCEPTRLPLALVLLMGGSFPVDRSMDVMGLGSSEGAAGAASGVAGFLPVDPVLFGGTLALTAQAVGLLPLAGFDGYALARGIVGPKAARGLELVTAVLLAVGALGRLGPNADSWVCTGALVSWAVCSLAAATSPMPPREDFDDVPPDRPQTWAAMALLVGAVGVLLPGRLTPYGVLETNF